MTNQIKIFESTNIDKLEVLMNDWMANLSDSGAVVISVEITSVMHQQNMIGYILYQS